MMFFGLPPFEATTKLTTIKLQLEVVTTDMCRLFHADSLPSTPLVYVPRPWNGWLDHSNVNRDALGKGNNNNIVKDETAIHRANTFGDVLILKGQHYGEGELLWSTDLLQSYATTPRDFCLKIDE